MMPRNFEIAAQFDTEILELQPGGIEFVGKHRQELILADRGHAATPF
jgi:hypothetical protein